MLIAVSLSAAIIPMIIYLIIIWLFDIYEREPVNLVIKSFLWGAIGAIFLAVIASAILSAGFSYMILDKSELNNFQTIFLAPFVEEITKGIFLLILFTSRKFDNMTDGIVYGGAIGLGFGMTENFFYFIAFGSTLSEWATIVLTRTLFSAVMHCVTTGTFGAFLGYAKFKKVRFKIIYPFAGLTIAMFIHFLWNYSVSFKSTEKIGFVFMAITVLVFIGTYIFSIIKEKKMIYNELYKEVESGLIPAEHFKILNSSHRNKSGWIDESVRKLYIRSATTLAFRKMQFKNSKGSTKTYYERDIIFYRSIIGNLLKRSAVSQT